MQKVRIFLMLLGFCWFSGQAAFLYAQNDDADDNDDYYESDWDGYIDKPYSTGDQTFTISLGVLFPAVFFNNGDLVRHNISPPVGGAGSLGYAFFFDILNSNTAFFFLGGEIAIRIAYTLGRNTVYLVPIGVQTGFQFMIGRFEIPINLTLGIVPQRYLNFNYFGFFMKGGASVFFRFNPDWSFGLNGEWSWYPQRPKEPNKSMDANIIGLTLAARYHF
ncbi:MAG: hypothetical protein LBI06_02020 [Treponema sp.]|jgi:hypothetical protein|nr:hypothetical protein [Treponema sp.]